MSSAVRSRNFQTGRVATPGEARAGIFVRTRSPLIARSGTADVPELTQEMETMDLDLKRIEGAARTIDPVFLSTPQYADDQLNAALGRHVVVKVSRTRPFKASLFLRRREDLSPRCGRDRDTSL